MAMLPSGDGGGNGDDGDTGRQPPRQHLAPRNYEDILKFAVENTVPGEEPTAPLSEERKAWLDDALSGMFTDETKIIQDKLSQLEAIESDREEDEERKTLLLENIADLCDHIDNAKNFIKMGGLKVLLRCLDDDSSEVRWRALELAATVLQNNPYVQDCLLQENVMARFLKMADSDPSDTVKTKAIYALSCHVREHDASSDAFVKADGFSCLIKAMQSQNDKLQIKAAFLLKALLTSQPKYKDGAQKIGMVSQLVGLLNRDHTPTHEHIMAALLCLTTDHPKSVEDCQELQLRLKELLTERIDLVKGKEEFQEEHQYCQDLLGIVFPTRTENHTTADR